MTDFETHPVGTAAQIAELEAAAAAAYEVAARVITDRKSEMADVSKTLVGTEKVIFAEIVSLLDVVAAAIRDLATPDQTAALDRLIAEAEARGRKAGMQEAASIASYENDDHIAGQILAAIKKGGA